MCKHFQADCDLERKICKQPNMHSFKIQILFLANAVLSSVHLETFVIVHTHSFINEAPDVVTCRLLCRLSF